MPDLVEEQLYGVQWLKPRPQALLADVMGLGKTAQALTAAKELGAQRVLVACPAIARLNWEREAAKWGLDLPVVRVTEKSDHLLPAQRGSMLAIASYDGIAGSKALRGAVNAGGWDVLVLDEAHRLKTADSRRTRAVYGNKTDAKRCLAGKAAYRWLLSASPFPNHVGELWTHLHALWPHLLQSMGPGPLGYDEFLARYCLLRRDRYGVKVLGYKDEAGLVELLGQIMLRRDEIRGLPDLVLREDPYLVEVEDEQLRRLEEHEEFAELKCVLESANARNNDLAGVDDEFIHLATLRRLTGILKAAPVAEMVDGTLGPDDKIVLFGLHHEALDILAKKLHPYRPAKIDGRVPDGKRNAEIDRFNTDPACQVFIGQIEACKEVINLPAANKVLLVEQAWSPETNMQCVARVHRRGQTRQVFAGAVAIGGSIDELVQRTLLRKSRNIRELMRHKYYGC